MRRSDLFLLAAWVAAIAWVAMHKWYEVLAIAIVAAIATWVVAWAWW